MKKKFLVSMLVVLSTIGLSACVANKDLTDEEEDDRDPKILEIFQLYQDNGGTLTYEEWLASIKGEKGDKGDQGEKGDKGDKGDPGKNGQDGKDGQDGTNGIDGKDGQDGVDGKDGDTPYIGENGNWWVGDVDTGVNATVGKDGHDGTDGIDGVDGKDGETPYIGENGNWWVGDVDTGVNATVGKDGTNGTDGKDGEDGKDGVDGKDGKDGDTPYIGDNGNWWIDGVDTGLFASNVQKFTITYHLNGGSLSLNESSSVQVNWGSTLNLPTPTKKGYTFAGWFIESSDVNNPTRQFYSIDRVFTDLNLYAHWTPATFTVYLDFDGGRYIDHETNTTYWWNHFVSVTTDQPYSLPVDILKDDCEFIGWYQGNVKWENTGIFNSGEDIYLTAKYNATEYYNITLDLDGGTCTSPTTIRVAKDGEYTLPTNVKKPGYEFLGWYAGNTLWNNSGTFTYGGNITLVAKYREMHTFKIQLNLNHGTYEGDTVIEVEYNAAYTLPHAGVTRDGKVFGGWYNGDVKWDFTGTFDLKEDIWLAAKWLEVVNYTVTLDLNGGTGVDSLEQTFTNDDMLNNDLHLPAPTKEGYVFKGYTLDMKYITDGTGVLNYLPTETSFTLRAKWLALDRDVLGDTYEFGRYPQTVVEDTDLISELANAKDTDGNGWLNYDGEEYLEFVPTQIYPYSDVVITSNSGKTTFKNNETYYFKVEPIQWRVLNGQDTNEGLLMSEYILDAARFKTDSYIRTIKGNNIYSNNYEYSDVRAMLNGLDGTEYEVNDYTTKGFYDLAFNNAEKSLISLTNVNNSLSSTFDSVNPYLCEDTYDKIFLLSKREISDCNGFSDQWSFNKARQLKITDFVVASAINGSTNYANNEYNRCGIWFTRTPQSECNYGVYVGSQTGRSCDCYCSWDKYGVVPALNIKTK